jgi:hypothetical protein
MRFSSTSRALFVVHRLLRAGVKRPSPIFGWLDLVDRRAQDESKRPGETSVDWRIRFLLTSVAETRDTVVRQSFSAASASRTPEHQGSL